MDNRSAPNGRTGCPDWTAAPGTVPQARQQKRLRWYLEREPKAVTAVLHILLRVIEAHLRRSSPGASAQARFGAVSFVHRFGASLNRHLHYHCCILDGVFDPLQAGGVQFRQASAPTPEVVAAIEQQVRRRVLRWFSRHGLLDPDDARDMLAWANSGFSLDAEAGRKDKQDGMRIDRNRLRAREPHSTFDPGRRGAGVCRCRSIPPCGGCRPPGRVSWASAAVGPGGRRRGCTRQIMRGDRPL